VLAEIRAAAACGPLGFIDFEDENLTLDRNAFADLIDGIRRIFGDSPPELRAMNGLYPPSLDDAMAGAMAKAGFRTLNLSLGSASTMQCRRFNRAPVQEAFDGALAAARRHGLAAVGYIIVGAPGQTARESVEDLLYLCERRVLAGVSVFYPAPGSPDFDRCRRLGLLPQDVAAYRSTAIPISDTTSRLETLTLLRLGRLVNFMKQLSDDEAAVDALPRGSAPPGRAATRRRAGKALLRRFLDGDGIFGLSPNGEVYRHHVSRRVVQHFLNRFDPKQLRGTR
jgi:hypothetical protein